MTTYAIASEKSWNQTLLPLLQTKFGSIHWVIIGDKSSMNVTFLEENGISKIFIPHWSHIISEEIFMNYECVVFHMTDLPYGRGGSPLQNLIVRGHTTTKISALKVIKELDAGPIYLKKDLSLEGSALEIFKRANQVIELMIIEIISKGLQPKEQQGEVVNFKRRKPEDGNIAKVKDANQAYDYIRMLDAEGYPSAFLETSDLKLEFTNAHFNPQKTIVSAHVRIFKR